MKQTRVSAVVKRFNKCRVSELKVGAEAAALEMGLPGGKLYSLPRAE